MEPPAAEPVFECMNNQKCAKSAVMLLIIKKVPALYIGVRNKTNFVVQIKEQRLVKDY